MIIRAAIALVFLTTFASAEAICTRPADWSREDTLAAARIVFVATITEAYLETPSTQMRDGQWYTVRYKFNVALRIRGDTSLVPYLTSSGVYNAPEKHRFRRFGEQSRFVPGDNILVITSDPGEVPISWISECADSMPWSIEAYQLLKKAKLTPDS